MEFKRFKSENPV